MHIITRLIVGGAQENTLLTVIGQMAHTDGSVQLVTGPTTGPEGTLIPEAQAADVNLCEIPSLTRAVSPVQDWRAYHALRRLIREHKPTVVHTHSSKAGILGRLAAWHERVPCIVHTIHGLPYHPYQSAVKNLLYIHAERFAVRRCHAIVSVADAMTAQALAAGVGVPEQFSTVYSGMRIEPFLAERSPEKRQSIRTQYGLTEDDLVIGKIARLFELKGHEYLFAAFAKIVAEFPKAKLFLVGDGILRETFAAHIRELGLTERVIFAGLIPPANVPDAIAAMDIVVHCSLREGLARVLPQALLSGKPVISFDVDGAREVVMNNQTGRLIPPQDGAALTNALRETLSDIPAAEALAATGREYCRTRFDWRVMADSLLEIYRVQLAKQKVE